MLSNIRKLYLSNFLTGLVFWYGIEKLFMQSIGIDAFGVGAALIIIIVTTLLLDIPAGILADKWSRKGTLSLAILALGTSAVIQGASNNIALYSVGYIFYGLYLVGTSGTFQALIYDTLHEEDKSKSYSKINGKAHSLFLAGAGIANLASGFIAQYAGMRQNFFLTVVPCVLNLLLILTIREPKFHKAVQKEKIIHQITKAIRAITQIHLLRALSIIISGLAVVELFKSDFSQLYMQHYFNSAIIIGALWAAYAFAWSLGSLIAHRLHARLSWLIAGSTLPLIGMALVDSWPSLVFFMIQAVASAALVNQIETRIQEATPSAVRASILSVLSSIGRAITIPASLLIGWLIVKFGVMSSVYLVAFVGFSVILYWGFIKRRIKE